MDRRTLLAITLCFLIFVGWQKFYLEPSRPTSALIVQTAQTGASTSAPTATDASTAGTSASAAAVTTASERKAEERKTLKVGTGTLQVSNGERFFSGWELKNYKLGLDAKAAAVDLHSVTREDRGQGELAFDAPELAYLATVQGKLSDVPGGVRWSYEDQNIKLERTITAAEGRNDLDLRINAEFKTKKPGFAFVSLFHKGHADDPEARDHNFVYWTKDSIEKVHVEESMKLADVATPVKWIGVSSRYFLMSLLTPPGQSEPRGLIQPAGPWAGRMSLVYPVSGNTLSIPLKAYFGPKELPVLRSVETTLDHTVDFGIFTIIAYPLLKLLRTFFELFHNYGVAIILLTVLVRLAVYPLTFKSMKSMKEMAKLQPQLQKIREKYADDKEALNREMMNLMRTHGYNPMAGCLPILVQMPVFFALYNVLYNAIELFHAPFGFWIHDLSAKDPYFITPILLSATMFLQQKLQPSTATDPMQQKMMQFMPLIFGFFMVSLPSGLTLYMLVSALVGILQQLVINKKLGGGSVSAAALARS